MGERTLILKTMARPRERAATTSRRSDFMRTTSAASTAMDVPDESAMPTEAATSAGESLMPSPTFRMRANQISVIRRGDQE